MVKYSRDQSTEAPRRRIWSVMALPYWCFHSQTRWVNASRPRALRSVPSARELALHHHLGGDARVICARDPQGSLAAHPMPAGQDVHLRLVQHVAHVQAPGHVRRRQQYRERRGLRPTWARGRRPAGGRARYGWF